jgi:hypothetical protein
MGQWLSIPLSLVGVFLVIYALLRPPLGGGAKLGQAKGAGVEAIEAKPADE